MDSLRQHPAFIGFWLASAGSSFGFQMLSVAVGWQIYSITGRALDLGLIGLVQFVPSVLLALPAGHIADQYDRRRIVLSGQLGVCLAISKDWATAERSCSTPDRSRQTSW